MSVKVDPFIETGLAISKIAFKLSENQDLNRLLKDTSENPLSEEKSDIDLSEKDFIHGNIRTVPNVRYSDVEEGVIVVTPQYGSVGENSDFALVGIDVDIFLTSDMWGINSLIQRPYEIMSRVFKDLNKSRVTGIGLLLFDTFTLEIFDNEVTLHTMKFMVNTVG